MAEKFAISSLEEAKEYLLHPVLGPRLMECTKLVTEITGRTVNQIFGSPDDVKLKSSLTLFAHATPNNNVFQDAIEKLFGGKYDPLTLKRI